jgi:bifunctional DNA-binding transcriptional regulator/antitoxin component of YhaV-PrlF toxin-antitoxin module
MPDSVVQAKVSHRGQTSLPAELRHRWGIEGGEAVAAARALGATVWLSPPGAAGVLPAVLAAEDIPWESVTPG